MVSVKKGCILEMLWRLSQHDLDNDWMCSQKESYVGEEILWAQFWIVFRKWCDIYIVMSVIKSLKYEETNGMN